MDDEDELKHMILNFRVSELHLLLAFAGRNKLGRKSELQSRALELLKLKSAPVSIKIRKLYQAQQLQTQQQTLEVLAATPAAVEPASEPLAANMQPHPNRYAYSAPQQAVNRAYSNLYQQPHQYQPPMKPVVMASNQFPIHPDVKFKRLPFYDHVGELIKPSSLVPAGQQRTQESTFTFHFTPAQVNAITMSRDIRPGIRMDHATQVQLRFCLLETTSEQEDCFPPGINVKVNSKVCPLPNAIPPNKPGMEAKRPPRPVNITSLVKLSPVVPNVIQVQWSTDYTRGYCMAVHVVNKKSSEDLLNRLKSKGVRVADYTRGMIKDKLKEDGEIATTSLRVSIACPLGKMRMTTPCRASTCNHFQCFDASLFLQMNEKKPQWMCPVCHKPAVYDKLVIDGYFQDVLESSTLQADCTEIQLYMDGSWSPLVVTKKEQSCVVDKVEMPSVKLEPVKIEPSSTAPIKKCEDTEKEKEEVQIVTLSDSDDEPLMPRNKRPLETTEQNVISQDASRTLIPTAQSTPQPSQSPSLIILDEDSPQGSPVTTAPPPPYNNRAALTNNFMEFPRELDMNPNYRY